MLTGQQRGRRGDSNLIPGKRRKCRSMQSDFRFAEPNIAAREPEHGMPRGEFLLDEADRRAWSGVGANGMARTKRRYFSPGSITGAGCASRSRIWAINVAAAVAISRSV